MHSNFVQSINGIPFRGKFYITTDSHARLPMLAGVFTSITDNIKKEEEETFYFDGGDFLGLSLPFPTITDTFTKFKDDNKKTNCVLNLGNADIDVYTFMNANNGSFTVGNTGDEILGYMKKFYKKGLNLVSLSFKDILKHRKIENDFIKPYIVLNDTHDGKKEKLLVTGLSDFNSELAYGKNQKNNNSLDYIKNLLKENFLPAYKKEKPDKVILMLHFDENTSKKIVDYVKNDLGIKETKLVIGGHPHSINDFEYNGTRFLYAPAQGKGAYKVTNKKDEIKFSKLKPFENKYIYTPVTNNPDIIANIDIANPIKMADEYKKIFEKPEAKPYFKKLATSTVNLKYRNDYDFKYAEPTELGTFVSNAYKNHVKTKNPAIGLTLSMDLREKNPAPGQPITPYNICDIINVEKKLVVFEDIDIKGLKTMLETSLREQNDGNHAKNFIEYSDNIMVDRYIDAEPSEPKIKQIYFKQNDKFIPLLDNNSNPLNKNLKFAIITDSYTASGGREGLKEFKNFVQDKTTDITNRQVLIKEFQRFEKLGIKHFEAAKINNYTRNNQ